ncbi:MAG: DUF808 family protein [Acidimicrobiales bacterium]|nr:DUF808 family protein [Acidimicrobiales bacterium]
MAVLITVVVYGVVAAIVKMDDVGLAMTTRDSPSARRAGRLLVSGMPKLLTGLSVVGTAAMLWVGGHILLVGTDELGWHTPDDLVHDLEELVHDTGAISGVLEWLVDTAASAALGIVVGALVVGIVSRLPFGSSEGQPAH